ncbi:MAG: alpha/beta hydrolase-fold protein [Rhodoglobus sp.]
MGPFLTGIRVIGGPLPIVIYVLAALATVLLILRAVPRGGRLRWLVTVLVAVFAGAAIGVLTCWIVGDLFNAFDVTLSFSSRAWVAAAFAGVALAIVNIARGRARRRAVAIASIVVFVLLGALGVNKDFGQYPTLASILGISSIPALPTALVDSERAGAGTATTTEVPLWQSWRAPADLPKKGIVGGITIPATVSHFAARKAVVYLPPAALVANPPALPVFIMLSGQPGTPENVFISGHLDAIADRIAAANNGLAPIVVVPDQLTAPGVNPMCVDSVIGKSATYLTVDVPRWIRANLNVQSAPAAWGIGGFSQGGTCSIQLGAGHPEIFGSILDVSGELEPKVGTPEQTIQRGFAGDAAAYARAKPLALLAAHGPYSDTVAVFAVGSLDAKYNPWVATVSTAASAAGMRATLLSSPGTGHDWYTVRYALEHGLPTIYAQMGLMRPTP